MATMPGSMLTMGRHDLELSCCDLVTGDEQLVSQYLLQSVLSSSLRLSIELFLKRINISAWHRLILLEGRLCL